MNLFPAILFLFLLLLCTFSAAHRRAKRMWILTDTNSRTPHTDAFYKAIFGSERVGQLFTKRGDGILMIRKEKSGFEFDGRTYYWYGLVYSWWNKKSRTCHYPVKHDEEMHNVRFADGSNVISLMFGCWTWQRCCGTDCCFDWYLFGFGFLLIFLFFAVAIICKTRRNSPKPADQVEIPLNEGGN